MVFKTVNSKCYQRSQAVNTNHNGQSVAPTATFLLNWVRYNKDNKKLINRGEIKRKRTYAECVRKMIKINSSAPKMEDEGTPHYKHQDSLNKKLGLQTTCSNPIPPLAPSSLGLRGTLRGWE